MNALDVPMSQLQSTEIVTITEARCQERVLRPAAGTRPEIRLIQRNGQRAVIKDFGPCGGIMRPLGRWLVGREARAYAQLNGLEGVPRYLGHSGASLMLEYVEALPLPEADPAQLQPAFFAELSALVEAIHARGVAHADLTCPNNILVTPAGRPVVLDFAAAIVESRCPFTKLLMLLLREQDRRGIAKAKQLYAPSLLTPEEKALLQRGRGLVAFVRVLMGAVRWLLRGLAAKPRRARRRAGGGVRTTRR